VYHASGAARPPGRRPAMAQARDQHAARAAHPPRAERRRGPPGGAPV